MSIRGNLQEASLPDFLQLLSLGRKTGRLSVSNQSNLGYIFIESGRIIHAVLVNRPDRLGDRLVRNHEITAAQLDAAIQAQGRVRERKVGEILIEHGAIDRVVLDTYVRRQTEEAIYFLLTWRKGEIVFELDLAPRNEILVSIDPEMVLMEGARRTDEWTVIEQEVPSLDAVFTLDRDRYESTEIARTSDLERIVQLLDGTRNAHQIIEETGLESFDVGKALYDLVTAGCVHPMRREQSEPQLPTAADVADGSNGGAPIQPPHLDYPQLDMYVAHKGDFADEARHKEATHHLAECKACTSHLGETHQPRTGTPHAIDTLSTPAAAHPTDVAVAESLAPVDEPHHLGDAEMLRYVQRKGEFGNEETRRATGRHVADCGECAKRVRKIQRQSRATRGPTTTTERQIQPKPVVHTGPAPRTTHLDAKELRQYAVRKGAFADKNTRKTAGLHIADCTTCAERLKRFDKKRKSITAARAITHDAPAPASHGRTHPTATAAKADLQPEPAVASAHEAPTPESKKNKRSQSKSTKREARTEPMVAAAQDAPTPEPKKGKRSKPTPGEPKKKSKRTVPPKAVPEHFDYAKLRSYAERSGAFANAETRRYARRHIMECAPCTEALRKVRRDIKDMAPRARASLPTDRRRGPDRRDASERRHHRRRGRPDRRVTAGQWPTERRVMLRRVQDDRRVADRRSISRRTAPGRLEVGLELAAGTLVTDAEVTQTIPLPPLRRQTAPVERPTPRDMAPTTPPRNAPPAVTTPATVEVPASTDIAETPTMEAPPATPAPSARGGAPKRLFDTVEQARRQRGVPSPTQPVPATRPPLLRDWTRIAAMVALVSLAGSAGWFGRALVSPDPSEPVAADLAPLGPIADAPAAMLVDSSTLGAEIGAALAAAPSEPDPVVIATVTPPPPPDPPASRPRPETPPHEAARQPEPVVQTPTAAVATPPDLEPAPPTSLAFGTVEDATGSPLANVHLQLQNTDIETVTDATGAFVLHDLPSGTGVIRALLDGYSFAQREVTANAGDSVRLDLVLTATPRATEADRELDTGQWEVTDRAEAEFLLDVPLPLIAGLWTETIAKSTGRRPRVRVTQLTEDGVRIAIVISRPRPQAQTPSPRVSALRVIPGTAAYPVTTGTASFGVLLITAKTSLPAGALQTLLSQLREAPFHSP